DYLLLTGAARDGPQQPVCDSPRLVHPEPRVATILTFSTQGDPRGGAPRRLAEVRAEAIVFPRTGVGALRRLSEAGAGAPPCGDDAATSPGEDRPARRPA